MQIYSVDIGYLLSIIREGKLCFKLSNITGTLSGTTSLAKRIPKASDREILSSFKYPMILIALSEY